MYNYCECGATITDGVDECVKCRGNKSPCDHFEYIQSGIAEDVPYCNLYQMRIAGMDSFWKCDNCEERRE